MSDSSDDEDWCTLSQFRPNAELMQISNFPLLVQHLMNSQIWKNPTNDVIPATVRYKFFLEIKHNPWGVVFEHNSRNVS